MASSYGGEDRTKIGADSAASRAWSAKSIVTIWSGWVNEKVTQSRHSAANIELQKGLSRVLQIQDGESRLHL